MSYRDCRNQEGEKSYGKRSRTGSSRDIAHPGPAPRDYYGWDREMPLYSAGISRRAFLAGLAAQLARTAERLPANRNVKWAVSAGLWSHYPRAPFTDILDVMRDTG